MIPGQRLIKEAVKTRETQTLVEAAVLAVMLLICALFIPALKGLAALVIIVYVFVERYIRRRTMADVGFQTENMLRDIVRTAPLIILVAIALQLAFFFCWKLWMPEMLTHIQSRLTVNAALEPKVITTILLATFGEEITFRALFQQRFGRFIGVPAAIVVSSVIFAVVHFSSGPWDIVGMDMFAIALDSVIYGIIFAKTRNVYVSWIAHALADLVALGLFVYAM